MTNAAEVLWSQARARPEQVALRCEGEQWTYERLRERTAAAAGALTGAGLVPGDRIGLVAPSVPEFAAALYGAHAAGLIVVAVNPMATRFELDHVVEHAGCALALAWRDCADAARESADTAGIPLWLLEPQLDHLPAGPPLAAPLPRAAGDVALIL